MISTLDTFLVLSFFTLVGILCIKEGVLRCVIKTLVGLGVILVAVCLVEYYILEGYSVGQTATSVYALAGLALLFYLCRKKYLHSVFKSKVSLPNTKWVNVSTLLTVIGLFIIVFDLLASIGTRSFINLGILLSIFGALKRFVFRGELKVAVWATVLMGFTAYATLMADFIGIYKVTGVAMEPELIEGDKIFTLKSVARVTKGDNVLFIQKPSNRLLIHRVIAVAGTQLNYLGGEVFYKGDKVCLAASETIRETVKANYWADESVFRLPLGMVLLAVDKPATEGREQACIFKYEKNLEGKIVGKVRPLFRLKLAPSLSG